MSSPAERAASSAIDGANEDALAIPEPLPQSEAGTSGLPAGWCRSPDRAAASGLFRLRTRCRQPLGLPRARPGPVRFPQAACPYPLPSVSRVVSGLGPRPRRIARRFCRHATAVAPLSHPLQRERAAQSPERPRAPRRSGPGAQATGATERGGAGSEMQAPKVSSDSRGQDFFTVSCAYNNVGNREQ